MSDMHEKLVASRIYRTGPIELGLQDRAFSGGSFAPPRRQFGPAFGRASIATDVCQSTMDSVKVLGLPLHSLQPVRTE